MSEAKPKRSKVWRRRMRLPLAVLLCYLLLVVAGCMHPSVPFDIVINWDDYATDEALMAVEEQPTLVVLQHGLWRSPYSLWRLERALRAHGYEVLNSGYSSTSAFIEDHAATLEENLEEYLAERGGTPPRLCFLGHSMGGLVIRSYLALEGAREPDQCLFIATPHQGASLIEARRDWFIFKLFMGNKAALQLSPQSQFIRALPALDCAEVGVIVGSKGDAEGWNDDIPGDDDGTVAVVEAQLPAQSDVCFLRLGHTGITYDSAAIDQALYFLRHGEFRQR